MKVQEELRSEKPGRKILRRLMKSTFTQGGAWITSSDSPMVEVILGKFPCLKGSKYVSTIFVLSQIYRPLKIDSSIRMQMLGMLRIPIWAKWGLGYHDLCD